MFEDYELRKLDRDTLTRVYKEHLTPEFPPSERKPLSSMEKLADHGRYECLGYFRGEELWAYAMLWRDPDGGYVLLDYMALCRDRPHGQGVGMALMERMKEYCASSRGMLVEAEALEPGLSPEETALRRRRLDFYLRAGLRELHYTADIFGVKYAMLLWGSGTQEEAMEAHQRLYHYEFTPWLYRKFIHIPAEEAAP